MVPLHRGRFVVVHLCSGFPIDPQNFSRRAIFLPKISNFDDFWGRIATFLKVQRSSFAWGYAVSGLHPPGKFFIKISPKGIYPFEANVYHKLAFSADFWAVIHIYEAKTVKFGVRVRTWCVPNAKFGKNRLRGYTPLGHIFFTKNNNFGDFGGCKPTFLKPKELNLALRCGPVTPSRMQNSVKIA